MLLPLGTRVKSTWTIRPYALEGTIVGYGYLEQAASGIANKEDHAVYLVELPDRLIQREPFRAVGIVVLRIDRAEEIKSVEEDKPYTAGANSELV